IHPRPARHSLLLICFEVVVCQQPSAIESFSETLKKPATFIPLRTTPPVRSLEQTKRDTKRRRKNSLLAFVIGDWSTKPSLPQRNASSPEISTLATTSSTFSRLIFRSPDQATEKKNSTENLSRSNSIETRSPGFKRSPFGGVPAPSKD